MDFWKQKNYSANIERIHYKMRTIRCKSKPRIILNHGEEVNEVEEIAKEIGDFFSAVVARSLRDGEAGIEEKS